MVSRETSSGHPFDFAIRGLLKGFPRPEYERVICQGVVGDTRKTSRRLKQVRSVLDKVARF